MSVRTAEHYNTQSLNWLKNIYIHIDKCAYNYTLNRHIYVFIHLYASENNITKCLINLWSLSIALSYNQNETSINILISFTFIYYIYTNKSLLTNTVKVEV